MEDVILCLLFSMGAARVPNDMPLDSVLGNAKELTGGFSNLYDL